MAGKKRKAEATWLEETDRALDGAFCGSTSSLSQFYMFTMGSQRLSFQEKLHEWILRLHENGLRLTVADIASHIQVWLRPWLTQSKNSAVFPNALSSPIRRSLQTYRLEQGGDTGFVANGTNCNPNPTASNGSSMDMHSDSPAHDSY